MSENISSPDSRVNEAKTTVEAPAVSGKDTIASTVWWLPSPAAAKLSILLLVIGLLAWAALGQGEIGTHFYSLRIQPLLLLAAVVVALIPSVRNFVNVWWIRLSAPSPRVQWIVAAMLAFCSTVYLVWTAHFQHLPLNLKWQDEFSYLLSAQMLARGHLWLAAHPCASFFDTFCVISSPVYASMFSPGTALMFVPAIWLHLPYYVGPLIASGLCVGAIYLIVADVLDGVLACLAALLLIAFSLFRMLSIMFLSQAPVLLLGMIMTLAYLRWRRQRRWGWAALLGAAAGWAGITRPVDALSFAIVLGIVMAMDLFRAPARQWLRVGGIVVAAALPFLVIQAISNLGVTGNLFQTAYNYYETRFLPGMDFGFRDHGLRQIHVSDIPQKQFYYDQMAQRYAEPHALGNWPTYVQQQVYSMYLLAQMEPLSCLWLLLPLSLLGLWDRRVWAIWGVMPVFLLIYTAAPSFAQRYLSTVLPALIVLMLLPIRVLTDCWPRHQAAIRTALGVGTVALALAALPQVDHSIIDQRFDASELTRISSSLNQNVTAPAVVLFHFNINLPVYFRRVTNNPEVEPVYNSDFPWPDDAAIIRAHDLNAEVSSVGRLGDKNLPLYRYYSQTDPRRVFYLYDRRDSINGQLTRLGSAVEMVRRTSVAEEDGVGRR
jgi:hypothetical protein